MLKLILIASVILFSSTSLQAQEPVGFKDFNEFAKALGEMSKEEFAVKGSVTNVESIRFWHARLRRMVHPTKYAKLNEKLSTLPSFGFKTSENRWILSETVNAGVGFKKQAPAQAYTSMKEFLKGSIKDEIDVFQAKVIATPVKNLQEWMDAASELDPNLPGRILDRANLIRKIGYGNENQFQYLEEMSRGTKNNVGFGVSGLRGPGKIENLADLLSAYDGPTDAFAAQFAALSNAQKLALMKELKKNNPELYEKVTKALRTRTKIGFEDDRVLLSAEKRQGRKNVGFVENGQPVEFTEKPKERVVVKGFQPNNCNIKTVLGVINPPLKN